MLDLHGLSVLDVPFAVRVRLIETMQPCLHLRMSVMCCQEQHQQQKVERSCNGMITDYLVTVKLYVLSG